MTTTTFVDGTTPVVASWLNDVNTTVYTALGGAATSLAALKNINGVYTVDTITALRALVKTTSPVTVFVRGYYAIGDGGGGLYTYIASDTTSTDNGGTMIVATDGGRWKLSYTGSVSVRQFGAKGDGTTDDTTTFTKAIEVIAVDQGGEVYVPDGNYAITGSGVTIPISVATFSGIILRGSGQGCTLVKTSGSSALITILGSRATIKDLNLNGNNLATSGIVNNTANDGQGTRIFNVGFVSIVTQGIYNADGGGHTIHDCYFLNVGTWALNSVNDLQNTSFHSNFIQGSGGILLDNSTVQCEGLRITDNTILATSGSGVAIKINHGLEIYISNNILDQGTLNCIELFNNTSLVKVHNNWISPGTTQTGVYITQNVSRCTFSGNTFNGGVFQFNVFAGTVGDIHSIQLTNNQFKSTASTDTPIAFTKVARSIVSGNITDDTGKSFVESGGADLLSLGNIFKTAQSVSGGVTSANNLVA